MKRSYNSPQVYTVNIRPTQNMLVGSILINSTGEVVDASQACGRRSRFSDWEDWEDFEEE